MRNNFRNRKPLIRVHVQNRGYKRYNKTISNFSLEMTLLVRTHCFPRYPIPRRFIEDGAFHVSTEFGTVARGFIPGCIWYIREREKRKNVSLSKIRKGIGCCLLPARSVNKITPTPHTSTGSAWYGSVEFSLIARLSLATTKAE